MEGEGKKVHQPKKIRSLRVPFFLYTDVKQGHPGEHRAAVLLQQTAAASSKSLTSS